MSETQPDQATTAVTAEGSSSSSSSSNHDHNNDNSNNSETNASLCAQCSKSDPSPSSDAPALLKPCAACKSVLYCSRECKKAHAKTHKKQCARLAQAWFAAHGDEVKMASRGAAPKAETFQKGLRKWQFDT